MNRTGATADEAVKAVEDIPCIDTIKNIERCMESYYNKLDAMELAFEHLLFVDPAEAEVD